MTDESKKLLVSKIITLVIVWLPQAVKEVLELVGVL